MRTLLSERFAPTTSSFGFVRLSLESTVSLLAAAHRHRYGGDRVHVRELDVAFPEALRALEPLTAGVRPRELLVEVTGGWTAYFDCYLYGTDTGAIGWITRNAPCEGLAIASSPHTVGLKNVPIVDGLRVERGCALKFEMYADHETEWLNIVRAVSVSYGEPAWAFKTTGQVQSFEETEAYESRRIRDRFTSAMLERYCRALGLDVFNPAVYGPRAVLIESPDVGPEYLPVMTLAEAQAKLGIIPGQADDLPG